MIRINLLGDKPPKKKFRFWRSAKPSPTARKPQNQPTSHRADTQTAASLQDRRPSLRMLADVALVDEADDQLGFKAFADAIAGIIDSPRTATPLVMAINAKWGAGKTTLAEMIKRRLEAKPAAGGTAPHVTCWFNSWMHDDSPSLATSLAAEVAQTANRSRALWRRLLNPLPSTLSTARQRRIRKGLKYAALLVLFILACVAASLKLGFSLSDVVTLSPEVVRSLAKLPGGAYATALMLVVILLFKSLVGILPVAKSVGEFVRDPQSTANTASMPEVRSQLGKLITQATPRKSKFVIFVDDLDRCRPPRSVDVLEAMNQLLDHPQVIVVMMADMHVVAKCAEIKYKTLEKPVQAGDATHSGLEFSAYGWNYIQKIIQLQFDLPVYPIDAIRRMLESLAKRIPVEIAMNRVGMIRKTLSAIGRWLWSTLNPLDHTTKPRDLTISLAVALAVLWTAIYFAHVTHTEISRGSLFHYVAYTRIVTLSKILTIIAIGVLTSGNILLGVRRIQRAMLRREIDRQIRAKVTAGELDFSRVEASLRTSSLSWQNNPQNEGLLKERLQRYLEDESEIQREAEDEVMRHLEPLPRHAKRLLNRLRLLLYVAHERKMFGGVPLLSPRHIGKWAVLCERWPELAQAICSDPGIMGQLENPKKHRVVVLERSPIYAGDKALQEFCLSGEGMRLGPIMLRLAEFAPARAVPNVAEPRGRTVSAPPGAHLGSTRPTP
jgi:hypothetical protein